jgi:hypothetical protein
VAFWWRLIEIQTSSIVKSCDRFNKFEQAKGSEKGTGFIVHMPGQVLAISELFEQSPSDGFEGFVFIKMQIILPPNASSIAPYHTGMT